MQKFIFIIIPICLQFMFCNLNEIKDVKNHEKKILDRIQFLGDYPENSTSTAFSHIFQGGYSAGYYSYKWAEVLDADAFELFLEKGVFDRETSKSFKNYSGRF